MTTKTEAKGTRWTKLESRVEFIEKVMSENTCTIRDELRALAGEVKGLKENELKHINEDMQKVKDFQSEIKGSIKTLKWVIGAVLIPLLAIAAKILVELLK